LTTHDIKRSEDVRARLGVLSEAPEAWDAWLVRVRAASAEFRPSELDGRTENLWWQTLAGTVAQDGELMAWDRLEGYLVKAMREAKSHTTWTDVNETYETAVLWFAHATQADPGIKALVDEWTAHTEEGVRTAILSQKLIQLTMPGIPDIYQGTEEVRPLLVDPDNRRAVDFDHLSAQLARISGKAKLRTLSEEKHRVVNRALIARRDHQDAFVGPDAGYVPLPSSSGHAIVFARTNAEGAQVVTVATRAGMELQRLGGWGEHTVTLPEGQWRDVLTGTTMDGGAATLAPLLKTLPVALMERL
jgi:(1->4)-alpha-D-glucan 1-alpha-D-glucosylmutase